MKRTIVTDSITRPANTTAYTAGDNISAVTTNDHFTFTNSRVGTGWAGTIKSARLIDSANVGTKLDSELWLFDTDLTEVADNSAFAPLDSDVLLCLGTIDFATADVKQAHPTAGADGSAFIQLDNLSITFAIPTNVIYAQLVARNAYVPVASERFDVFLVIDSD